MCAANNEGVFNEFTQVCIKTENYSCDESENSEYYDNQEIESNDLCDFLKIEIQSADNLPPLFSSVDDETIDTSLIKKEELFDEGLERYSVFEKELFPSESPSKSGPFPGKKKTFKTLQCNECKNTFKHKPRLEKHVQECNGMGNYGVKCEICQKSFKYKSKCDLHMLTHDGIKKYECDICHKFFSVKYNLVKHFVIHEGVKNYMCQLCYKSFFLNSDLKNHMLIHKSDKKYQCFICEKYFTYKHDLRRHLARHDGTVKNLVCPVCNQRFSEKRYLRNHILKH